MAKLDLLLDITEVNKAINQALEAEKRDLMGSLGAIVKNATLINFKKETSPDGTPWIPSKRAQKEGGQTLRDTGILRNSISYQVVSDTEVQIGTNVPYGAIHQFGFDGIIGVPAHTRAGHSVKAHDRKLVMPARPFIGINNQVLKNIDKAIEQWSQKITK